MHLPPILRALLFWVCCCTWLAPATTSAGDPNEHPPTPRIPSVMVVRSGRVAAFQEVAEAFQEGCRVHVQQLQIGDGGLTPQQRERLALTRLVVAVGQPAAEALAGIRTQIVYAMVPDPPAGAVGTNSIAQPQAVLSKLMLLKPDVRRVGVVYTRRVLTRMPAARQAAQALGLELVEIMVGSGPEAISAMYGMVAAPMQIGSPGGNAGPPAKRPLVDALWVGPDPLLIDSPVTYFLIQAQLMWRVPIVTGTRQLVSHGALLAVDWSPEAVGRHLAWQVNQLLDDPDRIEAAARENPTSPPEAVVNAQAARRLGIALGSVRSQPGWKFIE